MTTNVSQHPWDPVRPTLRERLRGLHAFCARCYLAEADHPTYAWVRSRPLNDRRR